MKKVFSLFAMIAFTAVAHAQLNYVWHHAVTDPAPPQWWGGNVLTDFEEGPGNNVYIAAIAAFYPDIDPGNGTVIIPADSQPTAYIAVYTSAGAYVNSWYLPTTEISYIADIDVCGNGDIIAVGNYAGTVDFDPGPGSVSANSTYNDGFVARYSSTGQLLWHKVFSTSILSRMSFSDVKERDGSICAVGYVYVGDQFDCNPGSGQALIYPSDQTGFILKLDGAGNYLWSSVLGGSITAVDISSTGQIAVCGQTKNFTDFNPNPALTNGYTTQCTTFGDFMVACYTANGYYIWHHAVGSGGETFGWDVKYDSQNNLYVGGDCGGLDVQPGPGTVFAADWTCVIKYVNGSVAWQTGLAMQLEVDSLDNLYCTDGNGLNCYGPNGNILWTHAVPTMCAMLRTSVTGNIYMGFLDSFSGDVDPGSGVVNHTATTGTGYVVLALKYGPVGMEEPLARDEIRVFPTVSNDIITLDGTTAPTKYAVISLAGQIVLTGTTEGDRTGIPVAELSPGTYFIRIDGYQKALQFIVSD